MEVLQQTLLSAMANPGAISSETLEALEKAAADYPYFQLAHTLVAKVKHDQQTPDAYDSLGYAAIHAPDRRHLRKVFYEGVHIQWVPADTIEPAETAETETPISTEEDPTPPIETTQEVETDTELTSADEDTPVSEEQPQATETAGRLILSDPTRSHMSVAVLSY